MGFLKSIVIIGVLFISLPSKGCGNEYGHSLDGEMIHSRWFMLPSRIWKHDTVSIGDKVKRLQYKLNRDTANHKLLSDLAWNYMKLGKVKEGMGILKPLVTQYPNEYNLVANYGTGFELLGQLDSALKYIERGVAINAKSHRGSEWIHVEILKAKIKDKKIPGWLTKNSIITEKKIKGLLKNSKRNGLEYLNQHIKYQLKTRLPFTPPPNRVMFNIMRTMFEVHKEHGTYENAFLFCAYSIQFAPSPWESDKAFRSLERLNKARLANPKNTRLPRRFVQMMISSRINPSFLKRGLHEFSSTQDSIEIENKNLNDTILQLKKKVDALEQLKESNEVLEQKVVEVVERDANWVQIIVPTLIAGVLFFLIGRRKKIN